MTDNRGNIHKYVDVMVESTVKVKFMDFSEALIMIKGGKKVMRTGWYSQGQWIVLKHPTNEVNLPFIYIKNAQDKPVPWLASQSDLLSEDWVEVR